MRLFIFGVRGSTPAPGAAFVRYGGNTSCIALAHDGEDTPRLVVDAGTGIRQLSAALGHRPFVGTILLGHLHWDHTQGLPFFPAGDQPGSHVDVYVPDQGDPVEVLARAVSPPHFPIRPDELEGEWRFHNLEPGRHEFEGFRVEARDIPHKGGRTMGFRISDGSATIAYMSDHSPIALGPGPSGEGELHPTALELVSGADVLLHDAQHLSDEFAKRAHYGHSTIAYAVDLAKAGNVSQLVLFHHDPNRTDVALDAIVASFATSAVAVSAAKEGTIIEVAGRRGEGASERTVRVHFLAVPVAGYLALMEHNDSLIREMDLVAAASPEPTTVPERLLHLAIEARTRFGRDTAGYRHVVEDAARRGEVIVDLETDWLMTNLEPAREFVQLLEEADDFARRGDLLAPPTPARVAHLRRWFVDELERQLVDGDAPAAFDSSSD